MKGGFICPYCKTSNACDCDTCKEFIKEGEYVNKWTEDGEGLICGNCAKVYSPDQSLEEEWEERLANRLPEDLNYWRKNASDDYLRTPISVLRYISELEKKVIEKIPNH
jgi:hypothetical protein